MLRFFGIMFLLIGGYSYQAQAAPTVSVEGDKGRWNCPFADGKITISAQGYSKSKSSDVTLTINCGAEDETKSERYSGTTKLEGKGTAAPVTLTLSEHNINVKDHCTVEAKISDEAPTTDFKVGYKQIDGAPDLEVVGGAITAGKEFKITNFFFDVEIPFFDFLLRECTADSDPWMFWRDDSDNLHRVYPTSTTNAEHMASVADKNPNNNNACLGAYDGVLKNFVTIGADHSSCRIKVVKEGIIGDTFTGQGAPTLAADAAVTLNNGKVMVHTGAMPTDTTNINNAIEVYVSTNRGFAWTKSNSITQWTSSAVDSGITASNIDNARNMVMIRLNDTGNTSAWWRIIKGQ